MYHRLCCCVRLQFFFSGGGTREQRFSLVGDGGGVFDDVGGFGTTQRFGASANDVRRAFCAGRATHEAAVFLLRNNNNIDVFFAFHRVIPRHCLALALSCVRASVDGPSSRRTAAQNRGLPARPLGPRVRDLRRGAARC